jgi:hypothetical protein
MPRRDGTGPRGKGPKTGRGLGRCNSDRKEPRFKDREYGGGFGQGRGLGIDQGRRPSDGRGRGSGRRSYRNQ